MGGANERVPRMAMRSLHPPRINLGKLDIAALKRCRNYYRLVSDIAHCGLVINLQHCVKACAEVLQFQERLYIRCGRSESHLFSPRAALPRTFHVLNSCLHLYMLCHAWGHVPRVASVSPLHAVVLGGVKIYCSAMSMVVYQLHDFAAPLQHLHRLIVHTDFVAMQPEAATTKDDLVSLVEQQFAEQVMSQMEVCSLPRMRSDSWGPVTWPVST